MGIVERTQPTYDTPCEWMVAFWCSVAAIKDLNETLRFRKRIGRAIRARTTLYTYEKANAGSVMLTVLRNGKTPHHV